MSGTSRAGSAPNNSRFRLRLFIPTGGEGRRQGGAEGSLQPLLSTVEGIPPRAPGTELGRNEKKEAGMKNLKVLKDKNVLIATTRQAPSARLRELQKQGFSVWVSPTLRQVSLKHLFHHLADIGISSVLVERGRRCIGRLKRRI